MSAARYQWRILQRGQLPLTPEGQRVPLVPHVCTVTLVWPIDQKPTPQNSVIVDPCFNSMGYSRAQEKLAELGCTVDDCGFFYITHDHLDHWLRVPISQETPAWQPFEPDASPDLRGLRLVSCPGHAPDLRALVVPTPEGELWIASDAILNHPWLVAWKYYWPNGYDTDEILDTWRSVALILTHASRVMPGHGSDIEVNAELIQTLLGAFSTAEHAERCPEVKAALERRLEQLPVMSPASG